MKTRATKIILHLIALEVKRRNTYWNAMKKMPKDFSVDAINQMRKIVEMKQLSSEEEAYLLIEIRTFELITE